jgi:microcystin-dependent protein
MAQPYVGEIRMFGGNFAPVGWMFCEGQLLPISENDTLFVLIGTTYGGDGESTFALPDLRGRLPLHQGNNFIVGETGGVEEVTLATTQIPAHTHALLGSLNVADQSSASANVLARVTGTDIYSADSPFGNMSAQAIAPVGGSQPHTNFQPYLCVNFIISLFGLYPSPT